MCSAFTDAHIFFLLQETCVKYWPSGGIEQYGEFAVSMLEEAVHDGFIERVFTVTDSKVIATSLILFVCMMEESSITSQHAEHSESFQ